MALSGSGRACGDGVEPGYGGLPVGSAGVIVAAGAQGELMISRHPLRALNGLRISEALGADITAIGSSR
jgi:hypothetical protein